MRGNIAAITGGLGDIIYSIPIMRLLNVTTLYVKTIALEDGNTVYGAVKRLIEEQGIEVLPTKGDYRFCVFDPALKFDYDLDSARNQPFRNKNHIIRSYLNEYRLSPRNWNAPFLNVPQEYHLPGPYTVWFLSPRWRDNSKVNWRKVFDSVPGKKFFIGFKEDYVHFVNNYGLMEWLPTVDLLEMAMIIKGAQAVYCNQSVALVIAQGLGKQYYLELKPEKTNTLFHTPNEHIL